MDLKEKILKEKLIAFKPLGGNRLTDDEFNKVKLEGFFIPFLEAMDEYANQLTPDETFWKRLESFISNVRVHDMMSEEEKQYILYTCEKLKK